MVNYIITQNRPECSLDINRWQFGDKSLNKECLSLKNELNKVSGTFTEKCMEESIVYSIEAFNDIEIYADIEQFELVLANYLSNAIQYVYDKKLLA